MVINFFWDSLFLFGIYVLILEVCVSKWCKVIVWFLNLERYLCSGWLSFIFLFFNRCKINEVVVMIFVSDVVLNNRFFVIGCFLGMIWVKLVVNDFIWFFLMKVVVIFG